MLTPQLKQALVPPEASTSHHSERVRSRCPAAAGRASSSTTTAML